MRNKAIGLVVISLMVLGLFSGTALAWRPNDTWYDSQWGMHAVGMERAWDYNRGGRQDVKVAVVDSGVNINIPDFSGTHIDIENAWDYVGNDSAPYDYEGHGTHVAATIGQTTNNRRGTAGIAFNTTLLPIRVLDGNGAGSNSNIAAGIYHAVNSDADIINLSLRTGGGYSEAVYNACEYAEQNGVLVVAAAGNDWPEEHWPHYPALSSNTLVVSGVNPSLGSYFNSQYGWDVSGPGIAAPAESILQIIGPPQSSYEYRKFLNGTSMAAPFVSGVAALILSEAKDLGISMPGEDESRVSWLRDILFRTSQDLGSSGPDYLFGHGMVRADRAMEYLQSLVPAPEPEPEPAPQPEPEPDNPAPVRRPTHDDGGR
jgi:serine protease